MKVQDVMTRGAECARPEDSISQAAEQMRRLNVGSLPVCGPDGQLLGMVTDRDITVRATAEASDPCGTCVRDVMSSGVVTCYEDEDVAAAAERMEEKQIRRLVVLDRDDQLVGIVSLGDLAVKTPDERLSGEALERVSQPAMPLR